jgi:hypothetical protein
MRSRLLIALLSLTLALNTVLLAATLIKVERLERRMDWRHTAVGASGDRLLIGLPRIDAERLGLSPEQQEQIREIRSQWFREEGEHRRRSARRHEDIPRIFDQDEVRLERVLPMLDAAHQDSRRRVEAMIRLYDRYMEVLTPAQQEEFKRMIRERERRHARPDWRDGDRDRGPRAWRGDERDSGRRWMRGDRASSPTLESPTDAPPPAD